jgi:hypothetical protein
MQIYYRISDTGYKKEKPDYINNENCLRNFCNVFYNFLYDIRIIADNVSPETLTMIKKYIDPANIERVSIGHGAGTFRHAVKRAFEEGQSEQSIVYFVENDYLHTHDAPTVMMDAIYNLGVDFMSCYDHPDKYLDPNKGGNPYSIGGSETSRVLLGDTSHFRLTRSTTMTFCCKLSTLRKHWPVMESYVAGTHPNDFQMFDQLVMREKCSLVTPVPGCSTHGESAWMTPLIDWTYYAHPSKGVESSCTCQ